MLHTLWGIMAILAVDDAIVEMPIHHPPPSSGISTLPVLREMILLPTGGGLIFFFCWPFIPACDVLSWFTSGEGVSGPICDHCALRQSTPLPHARYNLYTSLQAWTAEFKDSTSEVATYKAHSFKISYSTSSLIKISLFITIYICLSLHHDRRRLDI